LGSCAARASFPQLTGAVAENGTASRGRKATSIDASPTFLY